MSMKKWIRGIFYNEIVKDPETKSVTTTLIISGHIMGI